MRWSSRDTSKIAGTIFLFLAFLPTIWGQLITITRTSPTHTLTSLISFSFVSVRIFFGLPLPTSFSFNVRFHNRCYMFILSSHHMFKPSRSIFSLLIHYIDATPIILPPNYSFLIPSKHSCFYYTHILCSSFM